MSPTRLPFLAISLLLAALVFGACNAAPSTLDLSRPLDAPAVYRVSATTESRLSGPVSDLAGATELSAAFEATPISDSSVEVEVLYLAASVRDAEGESVSLNLPPLAGKRAAVEMGPPGVVSRVRGDEELLGATIPLISVREIIWSLFPPLPDEATREEDTWTGDVPVPFANLGGPPHRMRYVLQQIDASVESGWIEGYELSVGPRPFESEIAAGEVSGEGDLDVEFEGEFTAGSGYERTERTAEFDSDYIRLSGGEYANGSLHMKSTITTERLNSTEQLGLDLQASNIRLPDRAGKPAENAKD